MMLPMDEAWMILKRQTTLGEFHPDFPSPYGEVKYYHGTPSTDRLSFMRTGIEPRSDNNKAAYVSDDPMSARVYAGGNAYTDDFTPGMLIGVRGEPEGLGDGEHRYFRTTQGIPPERLVTLPKSYHDLRPDRKVLEEINELMAGIPISELMADAPAEFRNF
jgi:hypothetical protein